MQLTVWCYPADVAAWDDFIATHDVPDYRGHFIPTRKEIALKAHGYMDKWTSMGMWLPDSKEVAFFADNFDDTGSILSEKLENSSSSVRQRAAYVIEKIGPRARPLKDSILRALRNEKESLVRLYLCSALRAIGDGDKDVLTALRSLFSQKGEYLDALTERVNAAAALFC